MEKYSITITLEPDVYARLEKVAAKTPIAIVAAMLLTKAINEATLPDR